VSGTSVNGLSRAVRELSSGRLAVLPVAGPWTPAAVEVVKMGPVVRSAMTYRQALEIIRTHCADIISSADMDRVLGGSLHDLLHKHGASS